MGTNRTRRPRNSNKVFYHDWQLRVLEDNTHPKEQGFEGLHFFYDDQHHDLKKDLYESIRKDFLQDWIENHPCSRPWAWFEYDAPRGDDPDKNCFWHGTLPVERKHISGGRRCRYSYVPKYYKAVFKYWHYTENDLPQFESEASYLKRLNLLTKAEEKYLNEHPELLEPESIIDAIPGISPEMIIGGDRIICQG